MVQNKVRKKCIRDDTCVTHCTRYLKEENGMRMRGPNHFPYNHRDTHDTSLESLWITDTEHVTFVSIVANL